FLYELIPAPSAQLGARRDPMRALVLTVLFAVLPSLAHAQLSPFSDPTVSIPQPLHITTAATSIPQPPLPPVPAGQNAHCCSKKGALIGLSVGVGLSVLASGYCDGSHCGRDILEGMAVLAGLGAGIGAVAGSPNRTNPVAFPRDGHVAVAPVLTRSSAGGAM